MVERGRGAVGGLLINSVLYDNGDLELYEDLIVRRS